MSGGKWKQAKLLCASGTGIEQRDGYEYRGLGLYSRRRGSWCLVHLGTGHSVCDLKGALALAFVVGQEIADAGDWSFDSVTGYRNQFPDAGQRVSEVLARHGQLPKGASHIRHDLAQQIAEARA